MSLQAMFDEVEYEIHSMAWPRADGKPPVVSPIIELFRDLRGEVTARIDSNQAQGPGTPDDVITTAQAHFRELAERGDLSSGLVNDLCAQLATMRSQINTGTAVAPSPETVDEQQK